MTAPLEQILELYALKSVPRDSAARYDCPKEGRRIERRETVAEHVYSTLRLADFLLSAEPEFAELDRLRVYELILFHDDPEAITGDVGISRREEAQNKSAREAAAVRQLASRYPFPVGDRLTRFYIEFETCATPESRFAHGVDKLDALIHELPFPEDWAPEGFTERRVIEWFEGAFTYSPTFTRYFTAVLTHCQENGHFAEPPAHVPPA